MASLRAQVGQAIRDERARVVHYIYSRAQEIGAAGGSVDPDGDFVYRFAAEALEDIASEVESGHYLTEAR